MLRQGVIECEIATNQREIQGAPNYQAMIRADLAEALYALGNFEQKSEMLKRAVEQGKEQQIKPPFLSAAKCLPQRLSGSEYINL